LKEEAAELYDEIEVHEMQSNLIISQRLLD